MGRPVLQDQQEIPAWQVLQVPLDQQEMMVPQVQREQQALRAMTVRQVQPDQQGIMAWRVQPVPLDRQEMMVPQAQQEQQALQAMTVQ